MARVEGSYAVGPTKTRKSVRWGDLIEPARTALTAHRRRQTKEWLATAKPWPDGDWVFARPDGGPVTANQVRHAWKAFVKAVDDLPDIRFHDLRHSYATLNLEAGADVKEVSESLGHSRTAITQDLYQHVEPRQRRAATDRFEAFLSQSDTQVAGTVAGGAPTSPVVPGDV